jgi:hypothetical protein
VKSDIAILQTWTEDVMAHFPDLSRPQATVLAEASFALMTVGQWGLDTLSGFLAALYGQPEPTVRSRLREWYCEADAKKGTCRQELDLCECFVPLLQGLCELAGPDTTHLALALDASTVRDRLTILCVSVLVGGGAIPVAWKMLPGNEPGAWKPHWQELLRTVSAAVPIDWFVVVTADRGLYASWLFEAIQANGWHPLLRINANGFMRTEGEMRWQALRDVVTAPGDTWRGRCTCFKTSPLSCTLLATWDEGYADPWLLVSDLPPDEAEAWWYGLRSHIERGFRDTKRGLFQWHRARVTDPARAERMWLILALATLRLTAIGAQATPSPSERKPDVMTMFPSPRRLSLLRRGMVIMLAALVLSLSWPQDGLQHHLWPSAEQPRRPFSAGILQTPKDVRYVDAQPP